MRKDASLTHPHLICLDVNALFVFAIATSVGEGSNPKSLYALICRSAVEMQVSSKLLKAIELAEKSTGIEKSGANRNGY